MQEQEKNMFKQLTTLKSKILTRRESALMTHIQVQNWRKCVVMSLKYTPVTQSIICLIFFMCVATMHCLNYSGQNSKEQFSVYDSDIPLTIK